MQTIIEFLAVISGGMFGVLLARRKQMDLVGVVSVAFLTAFSGGTLRDVLLDQHPLFWIENAHYPVIVFVVAVIASLLPRLPSRLNKWLNVPDAFGMAFFSAVGTSIAIQNQTSAFVAVLFGVVPTATSAYALARQLGGDADRMSAYITMQTILSVVSLPVCVWLSQLYLSQS